MAGIYIHIPFCVSRCIYCGFYSTLVSNNDKIRLNITDSYTDALCKEIEDRKFFLLNKNIDKFPIIQNKLKKLILYILEVEHHRYYRINN